MLRNYLKIAWRNLRKNKTDSAISIGGLALGIACCILLVLYVRFDWSFDDFHTQGDRIYRVVSENEAPSGETNFYASAPYQLGPELQKSFPELEHTVRIQKKKIQLESDGNLLDQQVLFADSTFFNVFSFKLLKGSPKTVLNSPDNIVLSSDKAQKMFGTTDVLGKTVGLQLSVKVRYYKIAGIAANPPANSSLQFELIVPYENVIYTLPQNVRTFFLQNWGIPSGEAFVLLKPNADRQQLESKLPPFVKAHYGKAADGKSLTLQPLQDIHLSPEVGSSGLTKASSPFYSWILAGIALVVLIIACINFMSLTLSRSSARENEVGIRKAAGAQGFQVGLQFLGEALLTCFFALILGMIITELALPYFKQLVDKSLTSHLWNDPGMWGLMGGIVVLCAILTGLYPAIVLSRKKASDSLKSQRAANQTPTLVKVLIVIQFALSLAFISSAFIMHKQMNFISNKDLGFNDENVVVIQLPNVDSSKGKEIYSSYKSEISRLSQVKHVSSTLRDYGDALLTTQLNVEGGQTMKAGVDVVDSDFLETLDIAIAKGRGFTDSRPSDLQNGVLVNQTFVQRMGWENPIGKKIPQPVGKSGKAAQRLFLKNKKVIGVIHDYNYRSLYHRLSPLVLVSNKLVSGGVGSIWVKIGGQHVSATLASLKKTLKDVAPDQSATFSFLDDVIQQQYEEQQRWRAIVDISSLFAIGLACFGLLGLASLAAKKRTKEIGVRRVLGATVPNIVGLLSKDFLKLVVLGFIMAVPLALYAMHKWLAYFAYKIDIGPGIFLLAGGLALLIAWATVSWQSVRAALANPVESLRSE